MPGNFIAGILFQFLRYIFQWAVADTELGVTASAYQVMPMTPVGWAVAGNAVMKQAAFQNPSVGEPLQIPVDGGQRQALSLIHIFSMKITVSIFWIPPATRISQRIPIVP